MLARVLLLVSASCSALTVAPLLHVRPTHAGLQRLRGGAPAVMAQPGIAIIVDAEIEPDRVDEFIKVIEADAKGSRDEPGCLRFDVLRASDTRFFFYEAYTDADAVDVHKAMPHFKLWSDFKASGGCTSVSTKAVPLGDWGFQ